MSCLFILTVPLLQAHSLGAGLWHRSGVIPEHRPRSPEFKARYPELRALSTVECAQKANK